MALVTIEEIRLLNMAAKRKHRGYRVRHTGGGQAVRYVAESCNTDQIADLVETGASVGPDDFEPCGHCLGDESA